AEAGSWPNWLRGAWLARSGLIALGLASYWSVVDNAFLADDFDFIYRTRFMGVDWISGEFPPVQPRMPLIRPLAIPLFLLAHSLFGIHPEGYHATNLLLHLINALLIHAIVRQLWPGLAFLSAALFVTSPLIVEGPAWISARFDLLMSACYLAGVLALLRDRPFLAALGGTGAVLAKESGMTFPVVALGISLLRRRGWRPAVPALAVGVAYFALRAL